MRETVTFTRFCDGFVEVGRQNRFSYEGLRTLYDYLIDLEESSGVEDEYDPIGLCGDWVEYESFEDFKNDCYTDYESLDELEKDYPVLRIPDGERFIVINVWEDARASSFFIGWRAPPYCNR